MGRDRDLVVRVGPERGDDGGVKRGCRSWDLGCVEMRPRD